MMTPEEERSYREELFKHVRDRLTETNGWPDDYVIEQVIQEEADELAASYPLTPAEDRQAIARRLADDFLRLGPLEPMLNDPNVTEIMVNGGGYAEDGTRRAPLTFVEIDGRIVPAGEGVFDDEEHLMRIINQIGQQNGRACTSADPIMNARLKDGSRVLAMHSTLSPDGASLDIRKFRRDLMTATDMIERGAASPDVIAFLRSCVLSRVNIFVTGPTGSGKTTWLNVLSLFIPEDERVITIEDPTELQLHQTNLLRWEARPKNSEGEGEVTIRDLVTAALRARPDRIVVGEVRSEEAEQMLTAMTTGHDGSLSTLHSNDAVGAFSRLRTMYQTAKPNMTIPAIDAIIGDAAELIVHVTRDSRGFRHIEQVVAVEGYSDGVIKHNDLFVWKPGVGLVGAGVQPPKIKEKILRRGAEYNEKWFFTEEEKDWDAL